MGNRDLPDIYVLALRPTALKLSRGVGTGQADQAAA